MSRSQKKCPVSFGPLGLKLLAIASLAILLPTTGQTCGSSGPTGDLYWLLTGTTGTDPNTDFLGTTDNQALVLRLNNEQVLRIDPADDANYSGVNITAGYSGNLVSTAIVGGTVGGGGGILKNGNTKLINQVVADFGTVGGGHSNLADGLGATVSGGINNSVTNPYGTIPGGLDNVAQGFYSFAAGRNARALHTGCFVWADSGDGAAPPPPSFDSTKNDQFSIRAAGGVRIEKLVGTETTTITNAALQVEEYLGNGEAAWLRTVDAQMYPVLKLTRYPFGTSNYVEGFEWTGVSTSAPVRKFHIDKNGTFVAGSDFAEALPATGVKADYEPGDVLVLNKSRPGAVERSRRPYDTKVAGVYSSRPGVLGAEKNGRTRVDAEDIPVAITGIVPTKVTAENGPIETGDLLTTSSTPGRAMKAKPRIVDGDEVYRTGSILGKALDPLPKATGVIRVLVTLR
jgi:hypothetical protein